MTNPIESTMNCEQFADTLPDFLERDVNEAMRASLEAHAASCAECGSLLSDLRKLRVDAANLPELTPSRDLWSGIAKRIETPVVEIVPGGGTVKRWSGAAVERSNDGTTERRRRLGPMWMGLAAAGLVAITATATYHLTPRSITVPAPSTPTVAQTTPQTPAIADTAIPAPTTDTAQPRDRSTAPASVSLASNKPSAEETYDVEIKRLRVILASRRASLDSTTISVIERNLKVIDDAIAQCRDALRRDPASRFLIESLNDALNTKVQLLRTAAMLPARS